MSDRARIIRDFGGIARKFSGLGLALALGGLPMLAQAAGSYSVQAEIDYDGRTYSVVPTLLPPDEQRELVVTPSGNLKAYAQASVMSQETALLNFQIYETRKGRMSQLTAATLVIKSGREHVESVDTAYGKLNLRTKVEIRSEAAPASSKSSPNYAPVAPPKVVGTMPEERRAVPKPIGK